MKGDRCVCFQLVGKKIVTATWVMQKDTSNPAISPTIALPEVREILTSKRMIAVAIKPPPIPPQRGAYETLKSSGPIYAPAKQHNISRDMRIKLKPTFAI